MQNEFCQTLICVRLTGLEPARRKTPDPKSGASTNFATSATCGAKVILFNEKAKCCLVFRPLNMLNSQYGGVLRMSIHCIVDVNMPY